MGSQNDVDLTFSGKNFLIFAGYYTEKPREAGQNVCYAPVEEGVLTWSWCMNLFFNESKNLEWGKGKKDPKGVPIGHYTQVGSLKSAAIWDILGNFSLKIGSMIHIDLFQVRDLVRMSFGVLLSRQLFQD